MTNKITIVLEDSEKTIILSRLKTNQNIVVFDKDQYDCPHWRKFHTLCYFSKNIEKTCCVKIMGISAPDGNYYKVV